VYQFTEKQNQLDGHIRKVLYECYRRVTEHHPDARIILYGSRARGQGREYSDLDIIVLLDGSISQQQKNHLHDILYEIGLENDVVISAFIRTNQQWEKPVSRATGLYKSVQNEGILIE